MSMMSTWKGIVTSCYTVLATVRVVGKVLEYVHDLWIQWEANILLAHAFH